MVFLCLAVFSLLNCSNDSAPTSLVEDQLGNNEQTQPETPSIEDIFNEPIEDKATNNQAQPIETTSSSESNKAQIEVQNLTLNALHDFWGRVCPSPYGKVSISLSEQNGAGYQYQILSQPQFGTAVIEDDLLTYTPGENFSGTDQFTYQAQLNGLESPSATVTVQAETVSENELQSTEFKDHGPVFSAKPGTFAETFGVQAGSVAYDPIQENFTMFFETKYAGPNGDCSGGKWGIGRATSKDGLSWTQDDELIIEPQLGTDYGCVAAHPAVVFDGKTYHLFFAMHNTPGGWASQDGLGYTTSTDGKTFGPVSKINSGVKSFPTAIIANDILYVYYWVKHAGQNYVDVLWSEDLGQTWDTDKNEFTEMLPASGHPNLWAAMVTFSRSPSAICHGPSDDLSFELFSVGQNVTADERAFGLFKSADDTTGWALSDDLTSTSNPFFYIHPEVLKHGNNYLMWYSKLVDGKKVIHSASTYKEWPVKPNSP